MKILLLIKYCLLLKSIHRHNDLINLNTIACWIEKYQGDDKLKCNKDHDDDD